MSVLVLLRGRAGTGKTTVADALGRALRAAVIDKDDVKDVLDARYRDEHVGGLTYEVMLRVVERCLAAGTSVVCDSPLTYPDLYGRALAMAERHGAEVRVIRTVCTDRDEWRRRLEARVGMPAHRVKDVDDPRLREPERYAADGELVLDTARPLPEVIHEALSHVGHRPVPHPVV
jgi:predicted kinase